MKQPNIIARAQVKDGNGSLPATVFFTHPSSNSDTEAVQCGVLFDQNEPNPPNVERVFASSETLFLELHAKTLYEDIWIPRLRIENRHADQSYRGIAELLFQGTLDKFPKDDTEVTCKIRLQDNALFAHFDERNLLSWSTRYGRATLVKPSTFYTESNYRIIEFKFNAKNYSSLEEILENLAGYFDHIMWLISFLCKKYVHWFQLNMFWIDKDEEGKTDIALVKGYREPRMVQFNPTGTEFRDFEVEPTDLLIKLDTLRSSVAEEVFRQYLHSDKSEAIADLISMIMITHSKALFEQHLGISYTVLEMLVNEFSTLNQILDGNRWDKLRPALKEFLASQDVVTLSADELNEIKGKIQELNRYAYKVKLSHLFKEIIHLLPNQMGDLNPTMLMAMLIKSIKRRNDYIHKGKIESYDASQCDIALIRFLVSAWILKLLGYPLDQVNDQDADLRTITRMVNR